MSGLVRASKSKRKSETEVDDVVNYTINKDYLKIRRNKFWELTELMRQRYKPTTQEELKVQKFNQDFCLKHGFPPFSAARIKNHAAYTFYPQDRPMRRNVEFENSTILEDEDALLNKSDARTAVRLLYIPPIEQKKRNYTTMDKVDDEPMYDVKDNLVKDQQDENEKEEDQPLKKKEDSNSYKPRRIIAPPENPFIYNKLGKDQKCRYCKQCGRNCHNIRYGPFLAAMVSRFYKEAGPLYNEHDAAFLFVNAYHVLAEFEMYLDKIKLPSGSHTGTLPQCMTFDSLAFALNSVEWNIMWRVHNGFATFDSSSDEEDTDIADDSNVELKPAADGAKNA